MNKINDFSWHRPSCTHMLRRNSGAIAPEFLAAAIDAGCMSPYVGDLPAALRTGIASNYIPDITYKFHMRINEFVTKNWHDITDENCEQIFDMDAVGELFNSSCVGVCRPDWFGSNGVVLKLSFGELNAQYALKVFFPKTDFDYPDGHGAFFEISTGFNANHAEPRDNNRVYLAALGNVKYMMSEWAGDNPDGCMFRDNANEIYTTSYAECRCWNMTCGRRIDFGITYKTVYGDASYPVRKLYRRIKHATQSNNLAEFNNIENSSRGYVNRQNLMHAMRISDIMDYRYSNIVSRTIRDKITGR